MDNITQSIRKSNIDKVFSEMSPEAIKKLDEINVKLENRQILETQELELLNSIRAKLEERKTEK